MNEDEDAAGTLKSAHLAEWIHGLGGDRTVHHHHDPYYIDQHGKRHYTLPHGGYEGPGHSHYGKKVPHGYYGEHTPGSEITKGFDDAYGYYKSTNEGRADKEPLRKWWTKLEKDQSNGMSARKEYDSVGAELAEGGYDMGAIARILLEKEKAKQARAAASRLSDEDRDFAREIARRVSSHAEATEGEAERELSDEEIEKAKKNAEKEAKEEKRLKEQHEAIIAKEQAAADKAAETDAKNEDQERGEVEQELKEEKRQNKKHKKKEKEEADQEDKEDGKLSPPEVEKIAKKKNKEFIPDELNPESEGLGKGKPSLAQETSTADDEDFELPPNPD